MEPRNRFRGIDSVSLRSLASRYDKGCPTGRPGWKSIPELLKRSTDTGSVYFMFLLVQGGAKTAIPITTVSGRIMGRNFTFPTQPYTTGVNFNLAFSIYVKCPKVVWKLTDVDGQKVK
jgi:hypothetical protein